MTKTLKAVAIAAATFTCAAALSVGWTGQAEARGRLYVNQRYATHAVYHPGKDVPWYAVRAYYWNGPWTGPYYSYAGWPDYAKRNGIVCTPGSVVKASDGIWYNCQ
jgi:hypothetical protein